MGSPCATESFFQDLTRVAMRLASKMLTVQSHDLHSANTGFFFSPADVTRAALIGFITYVRVRQSPKRLEAQLPHCYQGAFNDAGNDLQQHSDTAYFLFLVLQCSSIFCGTLFQPAYLFVAPASFLRFSLWCLSAACQFLARGGES